MTGVSIHSVMAVERLSCLSRPFRCFCPGHLICVFSHGGRLRKRKVDELRSLVKKGPKPTPLAPPATQSKRQKTLDLLTGVASSDEDDSESGEDDPGALLNWRAKTF